MRSDLAARRWGDAGNQILSLPTIWWGVDAESSFPFGPAALSEGSLRVLAALSAGPSSVVALSRKTGLTRQHVHTLVTHLSEAGLLQREEAGRGATFRLASPTIRMRRSVQTPRGVVQVEVNLTCHGNPYL